MSGLNIRKQAEAARGLSISFAERMRQGLLVGFRSKRKLERPRFQSSAGQMTNKAFTLEHFLFE